MNVTPSVPLPHKILHVDDDQILRMITKTSLTRGEISFDVTSCASASEALEYLAMHNPDLFVFDLSMPIMNGFELLRKIRKDFPNLSCTPAIFMSGQETDKVKTDDDLHPVIGYIQKPFSPLTLVPQILSLWNKK